MSAILYLALEGLAEFQAQAGAEDGPLFEKEVLKTGTWVHPVTLRRFSFSQADLDELEQATNEWIADGNEVWFSGFSPKTGTTHNRDPEASLGRWLRFKSLPGSLVAIVKPTPSVAQKLGSAIRGVSVGISAGADGKGVVSSTGNTWPRVIEHVAATLEPVITGLKNFLQLAREVDMPPEPTKPADAPKDEQDTGDQVPFLSRLCGVLGLDAGASEDEVMKKVDEMKGQCAKGVEASGEKAAESQALSREVETLRVELSAQRKALEKVRAERADARIERARDRLVNSKANLTLDKALETEVRKQFEAGNDGVAEMLLSAEERRCADVEKHMATAAAAPGRLPAKTELSREEQAVVEEMSAAAGYAAPATKE